MNKLLIEDEGHDNPMNVDQLQQRMIDFLDGEYAAYLFRLGDDTLGYALINGSVSPKYLRQFFIRREYRRKGYGRAFFLELMDALECDSIDVEVLVKNRTGVTFWENLGFLPRSTYMRYGKD